MSMNDLESARIELEDCEVQLTILRDAIDGGSLIDWGNIDSKLAEGTRYALMAGQVALCERVLEGVVDSIKRLRTVCESADKQLLTELDME